MINNKIPIVFAFDNDYALPASIAIKSLIDCKNTDTEYDIFVIHSDLKKSIIKKMDEICKINWIKFDAKIFKNVPVNPLWPVSVYFRLLIPELILQYDKIIWSDVDVLFKSDLSEIYHCDIENYDWAGVIAEKQNGTDGIHTRFEENKNEYILMSGFMIINAKKWREEKKILQFIKIIHDFSDRLKMYDLDVLNLSSNNIKPLPLNYCVFENIYDTEDFTKIHEYPWLSQVYSDEKINDAKNNPKIIHYAGKFPKIWNRYFNEIPNYYQNYVINSPFYKHEYYFPTNKTKFERFLLTLATKLMPIAKFRRAIRRKKNNYYADY